MRSVGPKEAEAARAAAAVVIGQCLKSQMAAVALLNWGCSVVALWAMVTKVVPPPPLSPPPLLPPLPFLPLPAPPPPHAPLHSLTYSFEQVPCASQSSVVYRTL